MSRGKIPKSWENGAVLVTQQNQADRASSEEKFSFLLTILLHKHFCLQAYGLVSNHSPCLLWIFSVSWLPEYYLLSKNCISNFLHLGLQTEVSTSLNHHSTGVCPITAFTLVYPQWYFMKALQKDSSFLRTGIIRPNPGFQSVLEAHVGTHNAYLPSHH